MATLTPTQQQIVDKANALGLDPALALAVAQQESNFNQSAVGASGETGIYQLMPGTAAQQGVNPNDQTQNIAGGTSLLQQLINKYGDVATALWAYNAGPGAVAAGNMPASTQTYIPTVMSVADSWANILGTSGDNSSVDMGATSPSSFGTVALIGAIALGLYLLFDN